MADMRALGPAVAQLPNYIATGLNIGMNRERFANEAENMALSRDIKKEELVAARNQRLVQEKELARQSIVLNAADIAPMVPEYQRQAYATYGQTFGFLDAQGNTNVGTLEKMAAQAKNDPIFQAQLANGDIQYFSSRIQEIDAALARETNPKKREQLQAELGSAQASVIQSRNKLGQIDAVLKYGAKMYTPESLMQYDATRNPSVLRKIPTERKPTAFENKAEAAGMTPQEYQARLQQEQVASELEDIGKAMNVASDNYRSGTSQLTRFDTATLRAKQASTGNELLEAMIIADPELAAQMEGKLSTADDQNFEEIKAQVLERIGQTREGVAADVEYWKGEMDLSKQRQQELRGGEKARGQGELSYKNEKEAQAAFERGEFQIGDTITVGGKKLKVTE